MQFSRITRSATQAVAITLFSCIVITANATPARSSRQNGGPPEVYTKPVPPPELSGVVVLFSDKKSDMDNWEYRGSHKPIHWKFLNGVIQANGGDIITKQKFSDYWLHVEWREPWEPNNHGQERGNSGVAPYGLYEIQVLDSYGIASPGSGDCGAVYSETAPLVNACKPPRQWQTYDIVFRSPRWDASGKKTEDARVTVFQNGQVVQNNTIIPHPTGIDEGRPEHPGPGYILLQDHGFPVRYRDIWVVPLPEHGADHY